MEIHSNWAPGLASIKRPVNYRASKYSFFNNDI